MKKGFTLIELLGIILLLGIIATISIPVVLNVVDGVKEKSDEESIKMYIKAIDNKLAQLRIAHTKVSDGDYKIMSDGNICLSSLNASGNCDYGDILEIEYSGRNIDSGQISISNEKVKTYAIISNGNEFVTGYENNGVCYNFDSQTGTILEYYDYENNDSSNPACSRKVEIPPYINNVRVVGIADRAFSGKELVRVQFPNTLKTIGTQAFGANKLTTLDIPDSVETIDNFAFVENNIAGVTIGSGIGSGIKTLGSSIFASNNSIEFIEIYASQNDVNVQIDSFYDIENKVCWLKDTPSC